MKFNERLLENLPEEDRPIGEVVLFFIDRGLNLYHYFPNIKEGKLVAREDLYERIQEIVGQLLEEGKLVPDYRDESIVRLSPTESIYVPEGHIITYEVDRLRKLFPPGKKSDKITVDRTLKEFLKMHPHYTMHQIVEAGRRYIHHCNMTERPLRDCNNFILDADNASMLLQWLEEAESAQNISDDFI